MPFHGHLLLVQSVVGPTTKPLKAGVVDNQPFFKPQTDQPTSKQEPTSSPATVHKQPAHTDNQPRSTDQHLHPTNPPSTHSQQPDHRPKSDNWPTTASTHQPLANQPATRQQQPSHDPKSENRPSASFTHQQPATLHQQPSHWPKTDNSGFDPSTLSVQVQQSPETDMDTCSDLDNDSVMQELTTGHYEDGELSDPEQDTSVNDPGQSSTQEPNMWCTLLYGLDTYPRHGY